MSKYEQGVDRKGTTGGGGRAQSLRRLLLATAFGTGLFYAAGAIAQQAPSPAGTAAASVAVEDGAPQWDAAAGGKRTARAA